AIHIIPTLKENYDLVFIDADKEQYLQYYHLIFDKVKKGGYIIADNVLWNGKVLNDAKNIDKETEGIKMFNEFIKNDNRVENMLLPFRDGIMVIKKI
ncbi:MAG TPA: methyltransferase, partial [Bacteroidales bacterium]|nr:methyltransferase [Bacteroidales bacterium]